MGKKVNIVSSIVIVASLSGLYAFKNYQDDTISLILKDTQDYYAKDNVDFNYSDFSAPLFSHDITINNVSFEPSKTKKEGITIEKVTLNKNYFFNKDNLDIKLENITSPFLSKTNKIDLNVVSKYNTKTEKLIQSFELSAHNKKTTDFANVSFNMDLNNASTLYAFMKNNTKVSNSFNKKELEKLLGNSKIENIKIKLSTTNNMVNENLKLHTKEYKAFLIQTINTLPIDNAYKTDFITFVNDPKNIELNIPESNKTIVNMIDNIQKTTTNQAQLFNNLMKETNAKIIVNK